jgi:hypothetical protein
VARPRGFRAYCGATESGSCDAEVYARAGHACTRPSRVPTRARASVCVHARAHVCACVMSYRRVQHLRHQPCKTLRVQPQKAQKAMRCEPAATAALADRQAWRALRVWVRCGHSAEAIGLPAGTLSCRVNETCLASIACSAMARGNSYGWELKAATNRTSPSEDLAVAPVSFPTHRRRQVGLGRRRRIVGVDGRRCSMLQCTCARACPCVRARVMCPSAMRYRYPRR